MMKKILTFSVLCAALFSGCKKEDDDKAGNTAPDNIEVIEINKTIFVDQTATIEQTCPDMVFSIENPSKQVLKCEVSGDPFGCDGGGLRIMASGNGIVSVLTENDVVSKSGSFENINDVNLSLQNFTGQGEKYIGIESLNLTSDGSSSNYGWIKIKLSGVADKLDIISMGLNRTTGNSINAGQAK